MEDSNINKSLNWKLTNRPPPITPMCLNCNQTLVDISKSEDTAICIEGCSYFYQLGPEDVEYLKGYKGFCKACSYYLRSACIYFRAFEKCNSDNSYLYEVVNKSVSGKKMVKIGEGGSGFGRATNWLASVETETESDNESDNESESTTTGTGHKINSLGAPASSHRGRYSTNNADNLWTGEGLINANPVQHHVRPDFSFNQLILQAFLLSTERIISVDDIYKFIVKTYPFFVHQIPAEWQTSVETTLSKYKHFVKIPESVGSGSVWSIFSSLNYSELCGIAFGLSKELSDCELPLQRFDEMCIQELPDELELDTLSSRHLTIPKPKTILEPLLTETSEEESCYQPKIVKSNSLWQGQDPVDKIQENLSPEVGTSAGASSDSNPVVVKSNYLNNLVEKAIEALIPRIPNPNDSVTPEVKKLFDFEHHVTHEVLPRKSGELILRSKRINSKVLEKSQILVTESESKREVNLEVPVTVQHNSTQTDDNQFKKYLSSKVTKQKLLKPISPAPSSTNLLSKPEEITKSKIALPAVLPKCDLSTIITVPAQPASDLNSNSNKRMLTNQPEIPTTINSTLSDSLVQLSLPEPSCKEDNIFGKNIEISMVTTETDLTSDLKIMLPTVLKSFEKEMRQIQYNIATFACLDCALKCNKPKNLSKFHNDIISTLRTLIWHVQVLFVTVDESIVKLIMGTGTLTASNLEFFESFSLEGTRFRSKTIEINNLANYFTLLIEVEGHLHQLAFKSVSGLLEMCKFRLIRLIRHFVSSENNNGHADESYLTKIHNCITRPPTVHTPLEALQRNRNIDNLLVTESVTAWDQIRAFHCPTTNFAVYLDHASIGVPGFRKHLSDILASSVK